MAGDAGLKLFCLAVCHKGSKSLRFVSPGQETKKTWSMKTTENGGMANMSWSCKDI